jgi:hypothetical protein
MRSLIVTHPGRAHFDEFFAVSLVLAVDSTADFSIQRRNPTKEELDDPNVWVIDIGERYEPELRNFDHHQDLDLHASFVLVSDYLNLTNELKVTPWWTYKDKIDCFGPFKIAKEMGIKRLLNIYSPVEVWLLKMFEQDPCAISQMMRLFGQSVIKEAKLLFSQLNLWESCEKVKVKDKIVLIGLTDDTTGAQRYSDTMDTPAAISVTFDGRGKGWRLSRVNDAHGVDFSKVIGHKDILFAHKNGFVAKTKERLSKDEVLKLVELAVDC